MSTSSIIRAAVEVFNGVNEFVTFFQWCRSLRSRSNGAENQELKEEDDVTKLQDSLKYLQDTTLPEMRRVIDRDEWRVHDESVAKRLPELKAAVYDAEDLLENFRYYDLKVKIEGSATSAEPGTEFFRGFIQGNSDKLAHIQKRLDNQLRLLQRTGLHEETPRFDSSVRPETTSFPTEAKMFGRDNEIKELIRLLGVPANNTRGPSKPKRKRSTIRSSAGNQVSATLDNNEATIITSIPVLPMVGIGGVGKTTLAQTICSNPQVKKHFQVRAWICVSDDFDVKRLTKEAIEQFSGKAPTKDNLNSLQSDLADSLKKRRFLIVLDDIWSENAEQWKTFVAPFRYALEGSMMLVTTRSQKVADIVHNTMDPFLLEGLKDDVFKKLFTQCVFGSDSSRNSPVLKRIGDQLLPKLKGSPLAAKTLGRLLGRSLDPAHWNRILDSQLWELKQEVTDILPALQLSYMYLPSHLKRCFSFCAVYPKDYNFVKEDLAEIWVAEGFVEVEPQRNITLQHTACMYLEDLEYLSFFQKLRGKYVIHDLMHDMAQLVSKDECFIIKDKEDLGRIPQNVRHLSVLKGSDFKCSDLQSLCKQTKLRTLLCDMSLNSNGGSIVMEKWCTELFCMRVMVCASISRRGLPASISNMKNLRYLKIMDSSYFNQIPAALCCLYSLQLLCFRKGKFDELPKGFSNLINLQKFETKSRVIDAAMENGEGIRLLKNLNVIRGELVVSNLCKISKDQAEEIKLMNKEYSCLTLRWYEDQLTLSPEHNGTEEVLKALHPPTNIKSVCLDRYPSECLPSWSHGSDDPTMFSSLTEISLTNCPRLLSLELFLQPACMPAIKKMTIKNCPSLESVPVERFGGLRSLTELSMTKCPKINSQPLLAPSLKQLSLENCGNLGDDIDCRSLTTFELFFSPLASLTCTGEKLPLLTELRIGGCKELKTINGSWPLLKKLSINMCSDLEWENGLVLPSSLQELRLDDCGYFSVTCLENLTSLKALSICKCKGLRSIPGNLWSNNLNSLQELRLVRCKDLVSIGAAEGIAHIPKVSISDCSMLKEVKQPLDRGD